MSNIPYSIVVGSLMYVIICTRLDIAFVVRLVNRYQSNLGLTHSKTIKRVLRHHKKTAYLSLTYRAHDLQLVGYIDVD